MTYALDDTGVIREIIDSGSVGAARETNAYLEAVGQAVSSTRY